MASPAKTYPVVPAKHWWALRTKFNQAIPATVTPSYLAAVLETQENSAKSNILPGLKAAGLVDDDGKPTDRAIRWRDDAEYGGVCEEIRREVYPQELLDAVPNPSNAGEAAKRWFMVSTGRGQSAVRKMVAFYSLLTDADASAARKKTSPPRSTKKKRSKPKPKPTVPGADEKEEPANRQEHPVPRIVRPGMPEVRLNLEVRIDASVTADQIDQIFASMAKHLYRLGDDEK